MTPKLLEEWAPAVQLRNIYGVTEATVYQTAMVMSSDTSPQTAGKPLPGQFAADILVAINKKSSTWGKLKEQELL